MGLSWRFRIPRKHNSYKHLQKISKNRWFFGVLFAEKQGFERNESRTGRMYGEFIFIYFCDLGKKKGRRRSGAL